MATATAGTHPTGMHSCLRENLQIVFVRQIGKMLNAREPKIVNGPQILDKYVGESEANIRKLFAEAEEEEKRVISRSERIPHAGSYWLLL